MAASEPFFERVLVRLNDVEEPDAYPFNLPAVRALPTMRFHPKVTYIVGENGSGKSTLVEALAVATGFNAEGGTKNFRFSTSATESPLCDYLTVVRGGRRERDGFFLRAESVYTAASYLDAVEKDAPAPYASYGGKSLHVRSHGEAFLAIVQNRFGKNSLFFFDEPESALSPMRQLVLLAEIDRLAKDGCQFVIATHSPIVMAYPNSRLYWLDRDGVHEKSYQDTEHYQLTRGFLEHPGAYLKHLVASEGKRWR